MSRRTIGLFLSANFLFIFSICFPFGHQAFGEQLVSLSPSKLEFSLDKNGVARGNFFLLNQTETELEVKINFGDLALSNDPKIGAILAEDIEPLSPLSPYLSTPSTNLVIAPGYRSIVPIEIKLPSQVDAGGFYGTAIFSFSKSKSDVQNGAKIVTRLVAPIFLRLMGSIEEKGELIDFTRTENGLKIVYQNLGNIYLNPYGEISVINFLTGQRKKIPVDPWFVLPGSIRERVLPTTDKLQDGFFKIDLRMNRGYENIIDHRSVFFVIVGKKVIITLVILLILACFIIFKMLKYGNRTKKINEENKF